MSGDHFPVYLQAQGRGGRTPSPRICSLLLRGWRLPKATALGHCFLPTLPKTPAFSPTNCQTQVAWAEKAECPWDWPTHAFGASRCGNRRCFWRLESHLRPFSQVQECVWLQTIGVTAVNGRLPGLGVTERSSHPSSSLWGVGTSSFLQRPVQPRGMIAFPQRTSFLPSPLFFSFPPLPYFSLLSLRPSFLWSSFLRTTVFFNSARPAHTPPSESSTLGTLPTHTFESSVLVGLAPDLADEGTVLPSSQGWFGDGHEAETRPTPD